MKFHCPNCTQSIEAPSEMEGQLAECPTCKETIKIPCSKGVTVPENKKDATVRSAMRPSGSSWRRAEAKRNDPLALAGRRVGSWLIISAGYTLIASIYLSKESVGAFGLGFALFLLVMGLLVLSRVGTSFGAAIVIVLGILNTIGLFVLVAGNSIGGIHFIFGLLINAGMILSGWSVLALKGQGRAQSDTFHHEMIDSIDQAQVNKLRGQGAAKSPAVPEIVEQDLPPSC